MRTTCYSLILLLFLAGCSANETTEVRDTDAGLVTTYEINKESGEYEGPYTKADTTGLLMERGHMLNGKLQGIRELYYPDGGVKVRERYAKGELDDLWEFYHPNGQVELKGYYVQGQMYGRWHKYDSLGNLLEEVLMISNEEYGPFKEYYPNGNIQAEGAYLHGDREDGTLKLYDETGTLIKTMLCYAGRCYTTWEKK
jgi:antitoxin component YwqK of YwqJK toxin-antitoxin module